MCRRCSPLVYCARPKEVDGAGNTIPHSSGHVASWTTLDRDSIAWRVNGQRPSPRLTSACRARAFAGHNHNQVPQPEGALGSYVLTHCTVDSAVPADKGTSTRTGPPTNQPDST